MIYNLINSLYDHWLQPYGLGFLRVFTYSEFRAVLAIVMSFSLVVWLGPRVIRWLVTQKIGDNPEFYHKDLNALMRDKANTPTMGGLLISGAILVCTLTFANMTNFYIHMALVCLIWLSVLGGIDDWLKLTAVTRKPGSREGLFSYEKLLAQVALSFLLGVFIFHFGGYKLNVDATGIQSMSRVLTLPFWKSWVFESGRWLPAPDLYMLPMWVFVPMTIFVITGFSNAVNLTDGLDGLVSGIMCIVAFAFVVLAWIAGRETFAQYLLLPYIPQADELAIVAGAIVGSCLGFLWFNCSPAQVFMGDTGSLPLGGLIGYIAIVTRQEFLLLIIGGMFVLEAVSVMMQVGYFKMTKGKRIFRCAPIHHHFHLSGWTEQQVVVRFWLITAILAIAAMATIKIR